MASQEVKCQFMSLWVSFKSASSTLLCRHWALKFATHRLLTIIIKFWFASSLNWIDLHPTFSSLFTTVVIYWDIYFPTGLIWFAIFLAVGYRQLDAHWNIGICKVTLYHVANRNTKNGCTSETGPRKQTFWSRAEREYEINLMTFPSHQFATNISLPLANILSLATVVIKIFWQINLLLNLLKLPKKSIYCHLKMFWKMIWISVNWVHIMTYYIMTYYDIIFYCQDRLSIGKSHPWSYWPPSINLMLNLRKQLPKYISPLSSDNIGKISKSLESGWKNPPPLSFKSLRYGRTVWVTNEIPSTLHPARRCIVIKA